MKNIIKFAIIFFVVISFGGANSVSAETNKQTDDIVKPAIVHILRTFTGTAQIPIVKYDTGSNQFRVLSEEVLTSSYNEQVITSGFIINTEGYIISDSFITRESLIKEILADKFLNQVLDINLPKNTDLRKSILLQGKNVIAKNISIIKNTEDLLIISPLFSDWLHADIINKEEAKKNLNPILLLKVDTKKLPALLITDDSSLIKFYFDYINLSTNEFTENSFISQRRNVSTSTSIISNASYGGPVFAKDGISVSGMLIVDRQTGKPSILLGKKILSELRKTNISNNIGNYQKFMKQGFSFIENTSCKHAVKSFKNAKNSVSIDVSNYTDSYIAKCNDLIAQGKSRDTFSGFIKSIFNNAIAFFIIGALGTIFILYLIFREVKQILISKKKVSKNIDEISKEDLFKK